MAMSDDIAWFEANRVNIANQYPGQQVIIKNEAVVGAYPDYETAYKAGVAQFGAEPFLIKFAEASQFVEKGYYVGQRLRRWPFLGQAAAQDASLSVAEKLRRNGALVQVKVGLPKILADQLRAQGQNPPEPQIATGMIDTGASISTVSERVSKAAGLQQVSSVPISGVGGTAERPVMSAAVGLPEYGVDVDPTEIVEVSIGAPGFEILIGRDILQALELKYTGPHGIFNLTSEVTGAPQGGKAAQSPELSTGAWLGIGAGAAALVAGGLWAAGVFKK
jgi:hypothetical protein